jgi:hypothetical protein
MSIPTLDSVLSPHRVGFCLLSLDLQPGVLLLLMAFRYHQGRSCLRYYSFIALGIVFSTLTSLLKIANKCMCYIDWIYRTNHLFIPTCQTRN